MRDLLQKMSKTDQKARLPREWLGKEESPGIRRLVPFNNISRENRKITRKETDFVLLLFYLSCLICYQSFLQLCFMDHFLIALHDSLRQLVISLTILYPIAKCRGVCWNHHVLVSICPTLLRKYLLNCSPSATKLVSEHA